MTVVHYTARVKDSCILELPEEAQALGLQTGEEISVSINRSEIDINRTFHQNEKGLAAMREIAERQKNRPAMEGSDLVKRMREARAGAMYGYDPTE